MIIKPKLGKKTDDTRKDKTECGARGYLILYGYDLAASFRPVVRVVILTPRKLAAGHPRGFGPPAAGNEDVSRRWCLA